MVGSYHLWEACLYVAKPKGVAGVTSPDGYGYPHLSQARIALGKVECADGTAKHGKACPLPTATGAKPP